MDIVQKHLVSAQTEEKKLKLSPIALVAAGAAIGAITALAVNAQVRSRKLHGDPVIVLGEKNDVTDLFPLDKEKVSLVIAAFNRKPLYIQRLAVSVEGLEVWTENVINNPDLWEYDYEYNKRGRVPGGHAVGFILPWAEIAKEIAFRVKDTPSLWAFDDVEVAFEVYTGDAEKPDYCNCVFELPVEDLMGLIEDYYANEEEDEDEFWTDDTPDFSELGSDNNVTTKWDEEIQAARYFHDRDLKWERVTVISREILGKEEEGACLFADGEMLLLRSALLFMVGYPYYNGPCTLGALVNILNRYSDEELRRWIASGDQLGLYAMHRYMQYSEKLRGSFRVSLCTRIASFKKEAASEDSIEEAKKTEEADPTHEAKTESEGNEE